MKSLGTIALTFLTALMFALLISGCEGDRGEDGKAGIKGLQGLAGIMGPSGSDGPDGCGFDQVRDAATGFCIVHDDTEHTANHPTNGADGADGEKGDKGDKGDPGDPGIMIQCGAAETWYPDRGNHGRCIRDQ